ncbi:TlpA family protein disulfide reductase [Mucilaginibacter pallidiroseus]|uniref:TlpA family protein disulfide reductase n=1 Tax=Mucilaginibacter pallidiroseus TaxID=2599295 RepID=A0A563U4U5_9SPHI|nr:TlpA disulfide reductase family protein [Mucilaginibacter pallidiroseus]TWR26345.1 TlpA family protein disulfide reductase [Mucilaginibacter pallidiroseus]
MPQKIILMIAVALFSYAAPAKAGRLLRSRDSVPVLNRPAPEFHLKDLEGKVVSLSAFRGKVVVLDFWATWCVPCQQSFPAMEKALNHFSPDKDVVFLFIDTRETLPGFQNTVKAKMKKNRYPFHVVFDEAGPAGLQDKQYLLYGMPGVPTKFIIDANGVIRYQLIGYNPRQSAEESAGELIGLVERTKAMTN